MKPLKVEDGPLWGEGRTDEGCETCGLNGGEGTNVEDSKLGPIQYTYQRKAKMLPAGGDASRHERGDNGTLAGKDP